MPPSLRIFLAVAAFGAAATQAQARPDSVEDFSYVDTADHIDLTGSFIGTANGNNFTIKGIGTLTFNGASVLATGAFIDSLDAVNEIGEGRDGNGAPVVTFNGAYMDLFVGVPGGGFLFGAGDKTAKAEGGPYYQGDAEFSLSPGAHYAFVASDWTLSAAPAVPEPQAVLLFGAGLAGLAACRRLRKPA